MEQAYKPNFVTGQGRTTIIPLGRKLPAGSSDLPGIAVDVAAEQDRAVPYAFSYLVLHHEEFTRPRVLPPAPVSSYLTVSPITLSIKTGLVCFLLHLSSPAETGARTLSGSLPFGVRTFLRFRKRRPSGLLHCKAL